MLLIFILKKRSFSELSTQERNKSYSVEGKQSTTITGNLSCKEFVFPYLLPSGKFGQKTERNVALSATKKNIKLLLNYCQVTSFESRLYMFYINSRTTFNMIFVRCYELCFCTKKF